MGIALAREAQRRAVERNFLDATPGGTDPIAQLHRPRAHAYLGRPAIQCRGHHRVEAQPARLAAHAEKLTHDQTERDARSARIDAPAAIERDGAARYAAVFGAGLIAIPKGGIGAGVIAIGLAPCRARYHVEETDRVGLTQRAKETLGLPQVRQRLRVSQVR